MSKPYTVAIVGTGKIAGRYASTTDSLITTHAQAIHHHPRLQLHTACDQDIDSVQRFTDEWQPMHYCHTLDECLQLGPHDIYVIATPDDTHFAILHDLLKKVSQPTLIIVEKPLCTHLQELHALKKLIQHTPHLSVIVNHTRRYMPIYHRARAHIQDGHLGTCISGRFLYYGGWIHNGVHLVDTLRLLFNTEFVAKHVQPGADSLTPDKVCLDMLLTSVDGKINIEVNSFPESAFQVFELDLMFEKARMQFNNFCHDIELQSVITNAIGERVLDDPQRIIDDRGLSPMQQMYQQAVEYIEGDPQAAHISLQSSINTMETLLNATL